MYCKSSAQTLAKRLPCYLHVLVPENRKFWVSRSINVTGRRDSSDHMEMKVKNEIYSPLTLIHLFKNLGILYFIYMYHTDL